MADRINPIKITDRQSGEVFELDFSRESIAFMERQGFKLNEETFDYPATNIPKLFYYALRKNHKKMSLTQANDLLERIGGMTPKMIERLFNLYEQAAASINVIQDDEDLGKNALVTVEMD